MLKTAGTGSVTSGLSAAQGLYSLGQMIPLRYALATDGAGERRLQDQEPVGRSGLVFAVPAPHGQEGDAVHILDLSFGNKAEGLIHRDGGRA